MGRERLYHYAGKRATFTATFVRYGTHKSNGSQTVLLIEIRDQRGELVSDHVWINDASPFMDVGAQDGDQVRFKAFVRVYVNGYAETDFHLPINKSYKLENPTHVRIVEKIGEE